MSERLPWFPFYADDFLADEAVRIADLATRGAYICLLCHQWREGSIPADPAAVCRILGATDEKERAAVTAAMAFFRPIDGGRLANPRLQSIADEQETMRKARSDAGRNGAAARNYGKKKRRHSSAIELPLAKSSYSESESEPESESKPETEPEPFRSYGPEDLARDWNMAVAPVHLPQCRELNAPRRRSALQRLREHPQRMFWLDVIRRVTESAFCTGSNERGWRADFDFLLRPGTTAKVLEGKYENHAAPARQGKMARVMANNARVVQDLNRALVGGPDGQPEPSPI